MSTLTLDRLEDLVGFDLRPACEETLHDDPPPADYWVDAHGCAAGYLCAPCLTRDREWFEQRAWAGLECRACRRMFFTYLSANTITPLWR